MIKDEGEIDLMQRAAAVTERAFAAVLSQLELGMTASEIGMEVDRLFIDFGATHPSFHTGIRITGPGIAEKAVPGRKIGDTPIQPGCAITFDIGCVVDGYASDFGRTVFWSEPAPEIERLHDLIMESQEEAILAMKSGKITAAGLNAVAREVIEEAGFGEGFTHRLGHGIGIDVHEPPFLFPGDDTTLETGMCFTVEPSLRVPELATVRVEDIVMVTPDGGRPFHTYSHDLLGGLEDLLQGGLEDLLHRLRLHARPLEAPAVAHTCGTSVPQGVIEGHCIERGGQGDARNPKRAALRLESLHQHPADPAPVAVASDEQALEPAGPAPENADDGAVFVGNQQHLGLDRPGDFGAVFGDVGPGIAEWTEQLGEVVSVSGKARGSELPHRAGTDAIRPQAATGFTSGPQ